jgi:hypothetical protein
MFSYTKQQQQQQQQQQQRDYKLSTFCAATCTPSVPIFVDGISHYKSASTVSSIEQEMNFTCLR